MATHERLGVASALNVLDHNMLQEVCKYAHDRIRRHIQVLPLPLPLPSPLPSPLPFNLPLSLR